MDDLATQFSAIKQAELQTRVDYAVARKMLDSQSQAGDAAVKLIESAAKAQGTIAEAASQIGRSGVSGLGECVDCQG